MGYGKKLAKGANPLSVKRKLLKEGENVELQGHVSAKKKGKYTWIERE